MGLCGKNKIISLAYKHCMLRIEFFHSKEYFVAGKRSLLLCTGKTHTTSKISAAFFGQRKAANSCKWWRNKGFSCNCCSTATDCSAILIENFLFFQDTIATNFLHLHCHFY